jgi:hypothetical protein
VAGTALSENLRHPGDFLGDIDHVVLGPPGVVTINTKYHRSGTVQVDGNTVLVNGRRTAYIPAARREADRARAILRAALTTSGHPELAASLPVRSLIVVVGAVPRIAGEPAVPVVALQRLRYTVESMPHRLDADHVSTVYEVAQSEDNWTLPADQPRSQCAGREEGSGAGAPPHRG